MHNTRGDNYIIVDVKKLAATVSMLSALTIDASRGAANYSFSCPTNKETQLLNIILEHIYYFVLIVRGTRSSAEWEGACIYLNESSPISHHAYQQICWQIFSPAAERPSSFQCSLHTIIRRRRRFRGKILCCELGCSGGCITCRKRDSRRRSTMPKSRVAKMPAACAVSLLSFCLHCISSGCVRTTLAPI